MVWLGFPRICCREVSVGSLIVLKWHRDRSLLSLDRLWRLQRYSRRNVGIWTSGSNDDVRPWPQDHQGSASGPPRRLRQKAHASWSAAAIVTVSIARSQKSGHDAVGVVCDVGSADGGAEFVGAAVEVLGGPLDILVPNAGGPPPGTFASTPVNSYPDALDLNLMSIVGMCKAAVPGMQERGWGRVVAITSVSGASADPRNHFVEYDSRGRNGLSSRRLLSKLLTTASRSTRCNRVCTTPRDWARCTPTSRKRRFGWATPMTSERLSHFCAVSRRST